jgi:hypothetical protein
MTSQEKAALRLLKNDPSIVIAKSEKGKAAVVLN